MVGSAPLGKESRLLKKLLEAENVYSVAVDGGISFFIQNNLRPGYWLGDMDSTVLDVADTAEALGIPKDCLYRAQVMKDDTDMALAVEQAWEAGCEEILVFGGIGGERISHTIANIQLMQAYAKKDCHIMMISENCWMEVLGRGVKAFSKEMKGLVSVLSLSDVTENVEITGLQYGYKGNLGNDRALAVSNAFIGKEGRISVGGEGYLLLIYEEKEPMNRMNEKQSGKKSEADKMEAVVFDMDGVIFDSENLYIQCWQTVAEKYGISGVEEVCYECLGINAALTREIFLQHFGEEFPYDEYSKETSALFHKQAEGGKLAQKPGVRELLGYLKETGVKVALASSTRKAVVVKELEEGGLLQYFDEIVGGDMVSRSKPDPDIFLKACENLGIAPRNAFAVEDSHNGIRAAYRAGMKPVMVPDLAAPTEEMENIAHIILPSLSEVRAYFEKEKYFAKM